MFGRETDFEDLIPIGTGGYSSVFKCKNKLDHKTYALKRISLEKPRNSKAFKEEYSKVLEEVKHLCQLEHPNILRYYGCWLSTRSEPVDNLSLTRYLSDQKPTAPKNNHYPCVQKSKQSNPNAKVNSDSVSRESFHHPLPNSPLDYCLDQHESVESNIEPDLCNLGFLSRDNLSTENINIKQPVNNMSQDDSLKKRRGIALSDIIDSKINNSSDADKLDFYIQTELCDQTLKDYLEKRNMKVKSCPQDVGWIKQAFNLSKQMVAGLIFLSSQQIVHRDIKPSNIFLYPDLRLKYGDFGLVKSCKESVECYIIPTPILSPTTNELLFDGYGLIDTSQMCDDSTLSCRKRRYSCLEDDINYDLTKKVGTTMYASPEQLSCAKYTKKTDYYSLGLVLLELFVPLFTDMERHKTFEAIRKHDRFDKEVLGGKSPQLATILGRLVKRDSNKRPALDDLLLLLQAEELRFLKTLDDELLGPVSICREGETEWTEKRLIILSKKLYIYGQVNSFKAEVVLSLNSFKISLAARDLFSHDFELDIVDNHQQIHFHSDVILGLSLRVHSDIGPQLFSRLITEQQS